MNITDQDLDEIVAIQFVHGIFFGQYAIDQAIELQGFTGIIQRSVFKMMAELDGHPKWAEYAQYPTLFKISELPTDS